MSTTLIHSPTPWRNLVWKELWQMKEFFGAMVVLAAFLQLAVTAALKSLEPTATVSMGVWAYSVVGGFVALFAAASGATLYATEKEERTYQNLQLLPLTGSQLLKGKLAAALAMCCLFFLISILIAFMSILFLGGSIFESALPDANEPHWLVTYVAIFGLGAVEFFAWSWLFSVLLSQPLNAAMLGIFFASLGIQLGVFLSYQQNIDYGSLAPYLVAWPTRALVAGVVLAIATVNALRWLQIAPVRQRKIGERSAGTDPLAPIRSRTNLSRLGRLTWQSLRQSWKSVVGTCFATLLISGALVLLSPELISFAIPLCLASGGLMGLAAFSADQKPNGLKFLSVHGVSANELWLARMLPWFIGIPLILAAIYGVAIYVVAIREEYSMMPQLILFGTGQEDPLLGEAFARGGLFTIGILVMYGGIAMGLCFSLGQFLSLMIRSRILATVLTLAGAIPAICWVALMGLGGVSVWWSVIPIGLAFCVGGRILLGARLSERLTPQRILLSLAFATLTPLMIGWFVHEYRANELPRATVSFDRIDRSDPTVIRSIERRLRNATAQIVRTEKFPANLEALLPIAYRVERDYAAPPNEPTEEQIREAELNGPWRIEGSKDALMYEYLQDTYGDSVDWTGSWQRGEYQSPEALIDAARRFLKVNKDSLPLIREALQFAWEHQDQLKMRDPDPDRNGVELLFPGSSIRELLVIDFLHQIELSRPELAWADLKALTQYFKLSEIEVPERRHWYQPVIDNYSIWTLCQGMTPALLEEGLTFALDHLQPIDRQRTLEHQYLVTKNRIDGGAKRSHRNATLDTGFTPLDWISQIPCERERATRLVDNWFAAEMESLKRLEVDRVYTRDQDRLIRNDDSDDEIDPATGRMFRYQEMPDWEREARRKITTRWITNTLVPMISAAGFNYMNTMRNPQYDSQWIRQRSDAFSREKKELLYLQMSAVLQRLKTGEFPTEISDQANFGGNYFYFPKGESGGVFSTTGRWERNLPEESEVIAPNIPFIANRNPENRLPSRTGDTSDRKGLSLPPHRGYTTLHALLEPPVMWVKLSNEPVKP